MALLDDPDVQLVAVPLDSLTVWQIAQAMKRAGVTSRPAWLRSVINAALARSEASK